MSIQLINVILYSLGVVLSVIGVCVVVSILSLMRYHRSTIRGEHVDYFLLTNMYVSLFLGFISLMDLCIYSIYGYLNPNSSFDGWWCRVKSYILHSGACSFFYTFLLQAIYRLCCIVYPTRAKLQSIRLYFILAAVKSVLAFLQMLPSFLNGDIHYLPSDYHCQFAFTNTRGALIGHLLIYIVPFSGIVICYVRTMYYVRTRTTVLVTIDQHAGIRRDLIVLTRLVILLAFLTITGSSQLIITIIYAVTRQVPSWVVPFEWFMTILGSTFLSISQIFISPYLKKLRTRMHRVKPATMMVQTVRS